MIEAVVDRLEGAPLQPRRRWSEAFKEQAVAEAMVPGANVSAIARRLGIDPSQLFCWRKARRKSVAVPQPEVRIEAEKPAPPMIEITAGSITIRVDATIDEVHLRRVLRAVRSI